MLFHTRGLCLLFVIAALCRDHVASAGLGHKAIPPKMDPKETLPAITHKVFLQVEIDGHDVGRIVLGLFGEYAPKTVENFRALCACDSGEPALCYKGSSFHRIIPDFMIQGGDIIRNDGTGGDSIYGGTFEDEDMTKVKFNRKFLLAMANSGPDTNASQFFITTVKAQWLTGKHVIFGRIMDGSEAVVKIIEKQGTYGGIPRADKIVITDSGEIKLEAPIIDDGNDPHHNRDTLYGHDKEEQ
ncbi:cis-trans isomerase [Seminavis robusta]|uniref:Peptidyl-prolyl cis-trans isomerase n=1 Tax=Seminavis robusta TaxID=568900 RepID=A0A9N8H8P4_9STRA|nr:cis-trans isomerase [Seminavis robusta]|eukprot:Sro96_g049770.1 cis-trans isomerase (242) ;mRNA; r:119046-119977